MKAQSRNLDDMMRKGYRIYALSDFDDIPLYEIKELVEDISNVIVHIDEDKGLIFVKDRYESSL